MGVRGHGVRDLADNLSLRLLDTPREPTTPLIKEYTLNHNIKAPKVYSLIRGYWVLWPCLAVCLVGLWLP